MLAIALVAGASAAAGADAGGARLIWPESRQPIPNGAEVQLWEDFHLDPGEMAIPCQATPPSTVVVNGQSVDEVRQREAPTWSECGSVVVTGGWVAIGFDEHAMKAVAVPAVTLTEPDGCMYELGEIEGRESELAGHASWTVSGSAMLAGSSPSSVEPPCAPRLPLNGTVELFGPQSGGFGVIPWGATRSSGGEDGREDVKAAEELSKRMVTATRLAKLGQLFPAATHASFDATGAGALVVSWYAAAGGARAAGAHSTSLVLVSRGRALFSSRGAKRVVVRPTRGGSSLLRHAHQLMLTVRASFTPHGKAAIVVTGTSSLHR